MDHDNNRAAAPAVPHALAAWERPLLRRLDAGEAEAVPIGVGIDAAIYS